MRKFFLILLTFVALPGLAQERTVSIATTNRNGIIHVDGVTTFVDSTGQLSAAGGGGPTNGQTASQVTNIVSGMVVTIPTNAVLVSSAKGNDSTAVMGDITHPAKSLQYAMLFVQTNAPSNGLVIATPGDSLSIDLYQPSGCTVLASNTVTFYGNGCTVWFTNIANTVNGFQCNAGSVFSNFNYTLITPVPSSPGNQNPFGTTQAHIWWGEFITIVGPADDFSPNAASYGASLVNYPGIFHMAYCSFFGNWDNITPGPSVRSRTNAVWEFYNNRVLMTNTIYPNAGEISGLSSFPIINGRLLLKNNIFEVYGITNTAAYGAIGIGLTSGSFKTGNPLIFENNSVIVTNSGAGSTNLLGVVIPISQPTNFSQNISVFFLNAMSNSAAHPTVTPSGLDTLALNTGWTNDLGARADMILTGTIPTIYGSGNTNNLAVTNTVTGESYTNYIAGNGLQPSGFMFVIPDISPNDSGTISNWGYNQSITNFKGVWKLK